MKGGILGLRLPCKERVLMKNQLIQWRENRGSVFIKGLFFSKKFFFVNSFREPIDRYLVIVFSFGRQCTDSRRLTYFFLKTFLRRKGDMSIDRPENSLLAFGMFLLT